MRSSVWHVAAGRIESDDGVSSAGEGGMLRATTSSGRFAATVRGCRPPFAENSPPDFFPGAPGPQPVEGNTGCRPPCAASSAPHSYPGAPGPQPVEGNTGCRPPYAVQGLVMIHESTCSKSVQPTGKTP